MQATNTKDAGERPEARDLESGKAKNAFEKTKQRDEDDCETLTSDLPSSRPGAYAVAGIFAEDGPSAEELAQSGGRSGSNAEEISSPATMTSPLIPSGREINAKNTLQSFASSNSISSMNSPSGGSARSLRSSGTKQQNALPDYDPTAAASTNAGSETSFPTFPHRQSDRQASGLIEAVPVNPEQSSPEVVDAVPVPNKSSDPSFTNGLRTQRNKLLLLVTIGLSVGAVVGGACGSGLCGTGGSGDHSKNTSNNNTAVVRPITNDTDSGGGFNSSFIQSSSTNSSRATAIAMEINSVTFSGTPIAYPVEHIGDATPEEMSVQWLIEVDPLHLTSDSNSSKLRLRQRYALLTLWYHTSSNTWGNSTGWLEFEDECSWFGVTCVETVRHENDTDSRRAVSSISLSYNSLNGEFPPDLGLLTSLETLNLGLNEIFGSLPESIGQWSDIKFFEMNLNPPGLNRTLPVSMQNWRSVEHVNLNRNTLTGTLPEWVGLWTNLDYFSVGDNKMNGTLPESMGNWRNVTFVEFLSNHFTGTVPASVGEWSNLLSFEVSGNALTGTIPEAVVNWKSIQYAGFLYNNLTGAIPTGFCDIPSLGVNVAADCTVLLNCSCCLFCE